MSLDESSVGLCATCQFRREVHNKRGSVFILCQRSETEPGFPKYPPLPVLRCRGYEREDEIADRQ